MRPRRTLLVMFGEIGAPGTPAAAMVTDSTSWSMLASRGENFPPTAASSGPAAFAMSAASCGSSERAVMVSMFVSSDSDPVTSMGEPSGRPSSSRSGSRTTGELRSSVYVFMSWRVMAYPGSVTARNTRALAWYTGGICRVYQMVAPRTSTTEASRIFQRLKMMSRKSRNCTIALQRWVRGPCPGPIVP